HSDREIESGGENRHRLGNCDQCQKHALIGNCRNKPDPQPNAVLGDVDREHNQKQGKGKKRATVARKPKPHSLQWTASPSAGSCSGRLKAAARIFCSVSESPASSRTIRPSYNITTRSQQPMSSA